MRAARRPGGRLGVAGAVVAGTYVAGDVSVVDGVVQAVGLSGPGAGLAVPGMTDVQVNGAAGVDLITADESSWRRCARHLARGGVGAYVANLVTASEEMTSAAMRVARLVRDNPGPGEAALLGVQLEGPYLAASRAGMHPLHHLRPPDIDLVRRMRALGPVVSIVVAPELPGARELIGECARDGLVVALGHSDATAEQARAAFDLGARTVVHVFNAMSAPTAREAGLAGVALTRADVTVQLICDGVHVGRDTARLVFAAAADRLVLVTDCLAAAGAPDGRYGFGEVPITRQGDSARTSSGVLAGSVATLSESLARSVDWGLAVEQAVISATVRPHSLVTGLAGSQLVPGETADLVVLDDAFAVHRRIVRGADIDTGVHTDTDTDTDTPGDLEEALL